MRLLVYLPDIFSGRFNILNPKPKIIQAGSRHNS